APASAQSQTFTFAISCPGVPGSPFARSVTGSGTTAPVDNISAGTTCQAHENPTPGFVDQPDQTFPAVTAGTTQTVTYTNRRVPPSADLAINVNPSGSFAVGQNGTVLVDVTNNGPSPTSQGTVIVTTTLPAGVTF